MWPVFNCVTAVQVISLTHCELQDVGRVWLGVCGGCSKVELVEEGGVFTEDYKSVDAT